MDNYPIRIVVANGRIIIEPYRRPTRAADTVEWRCESNPFWLDFFNKSPFTDGKTQIDGTDKQPGYWTTGPRQIGDVMPDSYPYHVDLVWRNPGRGGALELIHHDSPDIIVE